MKKLTVWVCAFVYLLGLTGCNRLPYQLSESQFCYSTGTSEEAVLTSEEAVLTSEEQQYIIDLLNNASWKKDSSNCDSDYIFYTQKREVHYHSLCGTFHNIKSKKSTTLSPEQRTKVNALLDADISNLQEQKKYKVEINNKSGIVNELESEYTPGEEITVIVAEVTDVCTSAYVNGVKQSTQRNEDWQETFTFIMPCEDVLIEIKYSGSW